MSRDLYMDEKACVRKPQKWGAVVPLSMWGGKLGSNLTHCRLDRGLPSYQVASWSNGGSSIYLS